MIMHVILCGIDSCPVDIIMRACYFVEPAKSLGLITRKEEKAIWQSSLDSTPCISAWVSSAPPYIIILPL